MQLQINSANIGTLFVKVSFDIFNRKVIFDASGTSFNGSGSQNVKGISFSLIDQSGVELANGGINFTSPQIPPPINSSNWIWTLDLSSLNFAFLYQQYQIIAAIQDADGTIYQTEPVFKQLCQPTSVTDSGYVPGMFQVIPDTINSVLTVKEITQLVYNSFAPISVSKTGVLSYPTGTVNAVNFYTTPFSNNVIYTGEYRINCTAVATYALNDDVYVLVSYVTNNVFPVTVANKMADVLCCVSKIQQTAEKNCDNAIGENARQQMIDILPYMMIGFAKESSGQDSSDEVEYIKKKLACDCGSASMSQSQFTPINPAVNSIVLTGVGGTTIPSPTVTGNTMSYAIASNVYQVAKGDTGDLAFTISTNTSIPNTVQYLITINYNIFASSILTAIAASPTLINQLNQLVTAGTFSAAGLDGNCIINLSQISYSLIQSVVNGQTVSNIVINGTIYNAPTNTFANAATPLSAWLNSLSLGTFTVGVTSGVLSITSTNNTNIIATMSFGSPSVTTQFQSTTASLNQILQAIFNYVCNISALQVALGRSLGLCSFDYNGNVVNTTIPSTYTQDQYNSTISATICNIVNRISTLTGVTCSSLQNIFGSYPTAAFNPSTDWFMSVVGANCTQLTARQAALAIISAVSNYSDVKAAWCAINCSAPANCPDIAANNVNYLSTTSFGVYGVTFSSTTTLGQVLTLKYRVSGTTSWTTVTNALNVFANGNVSGTSPFVVSGLIPGTQYDVFIQNNCGGTGFISQVTVPASTLYTGVYLLNNSSYLICGSSPVTLYSSLPFGTGVTMYSDSGLTTKVTGYLLIAPNSTGVIYQLGNTTGIVGSATGANCTTGVLGSYNLGNSTGTICSSAVTGLYTNGAFAVGQVLYYDNGLTSPVTGYSYVLQISTNQIYNVNPVSGVVLSSTGLTCGLSTVSITNNLSGMTLTAISGISGLAMTPPLPLAVGGAATGTHLAFTGTISLTMTGTPSVPSSVTLSVNGTEVDCKTVPGAGTFVFASRSYASSDVISLAMVSYAC